MQKQIHAQMALASILFTNQAMAGEQVSRQNPEINGVISTWTGIGWSDSTDTGLDQESLYGFGGDARLSLFGYSGFGAQFDVRREFLYDFPIEDSVILETGAHILYSNRDNYTVGAFGGLGYSKVPNDPSDVSYIMYGLEGAYFTERLKLFGQLGLSDIAATNDSMGGDLYRDAWLARGGIGYSVTDSTYLSGDLTYTSGLTDSRSNADDAHALLWDLEIEHQFTSNASGFVGYSGSNFENLEENNTYSDHIFKVGFRIRPGGNSIQQSEIYVPFDLPNIGRAYAASEEVD